MHPNTYWSLLSAKLIHSTPFISSSFTSVWIHDSLYDQISQAGSSFRSIYHQFYAIISSLIGATHPVHLILFHFIVLPIFEDECINYGFLNVSTPLQDIIISSLNAMDQVSNPYKKQTKLQVRIYQSFGVT